MAPLSRQLSTNFVESFSFLWSDWCVAESKTESTLNQSMATNPAAQIRFIKHESLGGVWHPPQLIISIYYE